MTFAIATLLSTTAATAATGRAWELVTPPDPNGTTVAGVIAVSPGGDRIAYSTAGPLPGAPAGSQPSPNLAIRGPHGWDSKPIGFQYPVVAGASFPAPVAADENMSSWIWASALPLLPGAPESPNTGLYSGMVGAPTLLADAGSAEVYGASADVGTIVFQTTTQLLPADVRTSGRQVYEMTDGGVRLVGVDGAGVPLSACGALVGTSYQPNAVSRDGRRIFVSSPDTGSCGGTRRVYLREEGAVTREISASRCTRGNCNAPKAVSFLGATPSGAVAYLATAQQLTNDDVDEGQDLYRYEVESDALSRVSTGPPGVSAQVSGSAVYPSDDGSRVYFIASGTLVPGQGQSGPKMFVADGQGLRYVTTLLAGEALQASMPLSGAGELVQTTPDAGRLLFSSVRALTADDTDALQDIYLYDASVGSLTRVSGDGGSGNGAFAADLLQNAANGLSLAGRQRRSLTDDGRHVFFWTNEALVSDDVNGTTDVYEWDDGDLGLITTGKASGSVGYRSASADGSSVFIITDESLVPEDDDGGDPDLYVAREGGGFPKQEGPPPDACASAACTPRPATRLDRPDPASVDFSEAAAGSLRALPVSARARRRMAASGRLTLRVETPKSGRVKARALARMGQRTRTVAQGHATASRAGTVRLRLRLSPPAVRWLSSGRVLRLRVVLRRSSPDLSSVVRLRLVPPR